MASGRIHTDAGIGRSSLQVAEEEAFATAHGVALLHAAAQGKGQLAALGDVDVEVGTVVQTLVGEGLVLVVREGLEQGILVKVTGGYEVTYPFGTSVDVDVCLFLPGGVLHYVLDPVGARERDGHVAGAEMLHYILAEPDTQVVVGRIVGNHPRSGPLIHRKVVGDLGIVPHLAVGVGVSEVDELRNRLHGTAERCRDGCLAHGTALGGDEDDAVGASHTEHRGGGCVLEDRDAFDFIGVQLREGTLYTIDEHERLGAVERADSADADDRLVSARHAGCLDCGNAGEIALEGNLLPFHPGPCPVRAGSGRKTVRAEGVEAPKVRTDEIVFSFSSF